MKKKKSWRNLFAYMGPGFLVSIAYIDPGNFETDLQSGAQYKYELLWIILVASVAALIIQSLAANLGVVTGKHLAEHCRIEYPKVPNFILWVLAEIAIVACDIPEVIGTAFALNMLFKVPVWCGVLLTGLSTLILLALQQYGVRKLEFLIAFLVFTIAACFFAELGYAKPNTSEVLHGLFIPQLKGDGATGLAISLLGAMVMPHNLFLHSALVLSRKIPRSVNGIKLFSCLWIKWQCFPTTDGDRHQIGRKKMATSTMILLWFLKILLNEGLSSLQEACRFYMIESGFALLVAFLINVSVISVSGAVCNSSNLNQDDQQNCENLDLNKASFLLKNVLGSWSSKLFAIALLASGQSSTITGTYAGQYVMQGFLDLRLKPWIRNFLTRCLAIIPSLIVALIGGSAGAGKLIIIASSKSLAKDMIFHSSGMLIYLAAIAYLVFRKNKEATHLLALTLTESGQNGNELGGGSVYNPPREDIVSMQLPQRRAMVDVE
ncbi:unnamed protein product [Thlaspi arvense]|uniref:Uncharacterized protein n=1 Tax=Thlaspi arvense TaxID=13288 RepID=A0AAU9RF89_THLAR|nr:unnamed protein product [Thlaspi arvense]